MRALLQYTWPGNVRELRNLIESMVVLAHGSPIRPEDIPPEALHSKDRKTIIPPLHGALLKNEQDVHLFERLAFLARREGAARPGQQ